MMKRIGCFIFLVFSFTVCIVQAQGSAPASPAAPDPGFAVDNGSAPDTNENVSSPPPPGIPLGGLSRRDPFTLPEYILIKIRQKSSSKVATADKIDETSPPIIRWPLNNYKLVGIIWDVNKPKAMFLDQMKNVHIVKVNDFIGNLRGVVTNIKAGSVTIKEGQIPQVIKLNK